MSQFSTRVGPTITRSQIHPKPLPKQLSCRGHPTQIVQNFRVSWSPNRTHESIIEPNLRNRLTFCVHPFLFFLSLSQVCNAVYVRLNYTQPLCACPPRWVLWTWLSYTIFVRTCENWPRINRPNNKNKAFFSLTLWDRPRGDQTKPNHRSWLARVDRGVV